MSNITRIIALVVVVLVIVNYASYAQSGKFPAREWLLNAGNLFSKLKSHATPDADKVKISKWVDAKGVTHFENRPVEGASTLEVDPNTNVLPPAPIINLPEAQAKRPKTMNEEVQELQKAKDAYYESVINN